MADKKLKIHTLYFSSEKTFGFSSEEIIQLSSRFNVVTPHDNSPVECEVGVIILEVQIEEKKNELSVFNSNLFLLSEKDKLIEIERVSFMKDVLLPIFPKERIRGDLASFSDKTFDFCRRVKKIYNIQYRKEVEKTKPKDLFEEWAYNRKSI